MSQSGGSLDVSEAVAVVQALNGALDSPVSGRARVKTMVSELRRLMHRNADVELMLFDQLSRLPSPRLIDRFNDGPVFDKLEPRTDEQMQAIVDLCGPLWQTFQHKILVDGPAVALARQDMPEWYESVFLPELLEPAGWADAAAAAWRIDQTDHMVQLHVFRTPDQPDFTQDDRDLILLMVQAMSPLIDRELFAGLHLGLEGLSPRQQDVLRLLLHGHSEKEAAREMHRSVETVHNHVRAIYRHFNVKSRGELMARFIDQERLR